MLHMSIEPATKEGANRLHTHPAKSHKLLSHSQMKYKRALTWAAGYGSKPKSPNKTLGQNGLGSQKIHFTNLSMWKPTRESEGYP